MNFFANTKPEGIVVGSHEEGIAILRDFASQIFGSHSWALLTLDESSGEYSYHTRITEPCYGGLRSYGSLSKNRPGDYWPSDLHGWPFPPNGKPIALAVPIRYYNTPYNKVSVEEWNTYISFVIDRELSPWKLIMKNVELIEGRSFLFHDLDIDPTILLNFLMYLRYVNNHLVLNFVNMLKYLDVLGDKRKAFYLSAFSRPASNSSNGEMLKVYNTYLIYGNPKRIIEGNPRILTEGSFGDRYDYNRPEVERIFYDDTDQEWDNPIRFFFGKFVERRETREILDILEKTLAS